MVEHNHSIGFPKEEAEGPELFFGLVGPLGTDLNTAVDALKASLKARCYSVYSVRLSHLLCEQDADLENKWKGLEDERIRAAMDAGNALCKKLEANDAVMRLGLAKLRNIRRNYHLKHGRTDASLDKVPIPRTAYIFTSLKRPEEADTLRAVCRDAFFLISVNASRHRRITTLAQKIAKSRHAAVSHIHVKSAEELIRDDEDEEDNPFGQRVSLVFHRGDFFVEQNNTLAYNIDRFIKLLFGAPFLTPSRDEYGIFLAHAIALRSADLSRQVGAVILNDDGDVISEGCNEVPLQGGGAVWYDTAARSGYDNRDYKIGHDASAISKVEIFSELIERLQAIEWLKPEVAGKASDDIKKQAFQYFNEKYKKGFLENSKLTRILEYGRVVHAEMHALSSAARLGRSVKGATLYCTTFPCHMCARHILASGITKVVYIEPYPKSATSELYGSMVEIEGDPSALSNALVFSPFNGVAPKQYFDRFSMKRRKDGKGYALPENHLDDKPYVQTLIIDFGFESFKINELTKIIKADAEQGEGECQ